MVDIIAFLLMLLLLLFSTHLINVMIISKDAAYEVSNLMCLGRRKKCINLL